MSLAMRSEACAMSEIPFLLFLLHRGGRVVIDDPALPLRTAGQQHLLDDLGERGGLAFHGTRERIAAERAESDAAHLRLLTGLQRHALVIDHDECPIALHNGTARRKIQGYERYVLQMDVLPDIELRPVG